MKATSRVNVNFPRVKIISRDKLIKWYRETISPTLESIKDLGTGSDFCFGLEILFPGCIGKHWIKFENPSVYDRRQNFKRFQSALYTLNLNKDVPIDKLEIGHRGETYFFALWFKAFFEANHISTANDLNKLQAFLSKLKYNRRMAARGGFRKNIDRWFRKKATKGKLSVSFRANINSKKDTSETKISRQRKINLPLISDSIINSPIPSFSKSEQNGYKLSGRIKPLEQQTFQALSKQTGVMKDLPERKRVFEDGEVDFEKRIGNLQQLNVYFIQGPHDDSTNHPNTSDPIRIFCRLEDINEYEDTPKSNEEARMKTTFPEIELDEINQVVKEQRRVIGELEEEKEYKSQQITTLESIVCDLMQTIRELKHVKQRQVRRIKDLHESTNMQMRQMEDLQQISNELLESLADLTKTKVEQSRRIDDLVQANRDASRNNTFLTKSNMEMAAHIEDLQKNYRDVIQQNDNLAKFNKQLTRHYSDLLSKNGELQQRNECLAKNYETLLCYSCVEVNLYFKQLLKIEKACKGESNSCLRKRLNTILNQTKYNSLSAPGSRSMKT